MREQQTKKESRMTNYGKELILDIHGCKPARDDTRDKIEGFMIVLCAQIEMIRAELHFWDYQGEQEEYDAAPPHLKGTSAVQFIMTSSIVIHTLDQLSAVYVNIFSCKEFDAEIAEKFTVEWFGAGDCSARFIERN